MSAQPWDAALHAAPLSENQKIEKLLQAVLDSNLIFIRGGEEYTAERAVEHMRMKWDYIGDRIQTARQFIEYVATRSSILGTPYYVKLNDGRRVESAVWLKARLAEIEQTNSASGENSECCSISE